MWKYIQHKPAPGCCYLHPHSAHTASLTSRSWAPVLWAQAPFCLYQRAQTPHLSFGALHDPYANPLPGLISHSCPSDTSRLHPTPPLAVPRHPYVFQSPQICFDHHLSRNHLIPSCTSKDKTQQEPPSSLSWITASASHTELPDPSTALLTHSSQQPVCNSAQTWMDHVILLQRSRPQDKGMRLLES